MPFINKDKKPRSLKRLENSDLITLKDELDNLYVVTKQETSKVIRDYVANEIGNLPDEISGRHKKDLQSALDQKMRTLEKELVAFIDYKFDTIAEKACEMLINRKFIEEVNKRVDEKIEKLLLEKQKKGRF
jgi:hypothetical protein